MAGMAIKNFAGVNPRDQRFFEMGLDDNELFNDPVNWFPGQTQFTSENIDPQFRQTQDFWRTIKRNTPNIMDLPDFLTDPGTQWNDPRVRPYFGVNPETLAGEGNTINPTHPDHLTKGGFGNFAKLAAPFFLGGGALLGGFGAGGFGAAAGGSTGAGAATTGLFDAASVPGGFGLGSTGAAGAGGAVGAGAAGGAAVPFTELGRQAGFADTLRNVGLGQAVKTGLPASLGSALNLGGAANTARGLFAPQQDQQLGWRDLLGLGITGAQTYIGYNEAQDRADAANKQSDLARQIYETEHGYRLPFIQDATNILQNPNDYFNRPDVKGSVDATLRGLSADVGNPFGNPTALAKSAAYNLGGYQNALNSATGRAGIGNSASIGGLGNQYGNSIMNAANAGAGPGAALSYGLGGLGSLLSRTNPYLLT